MIIRREPMPLRPLLRRHARRRQLAAAAVLACALGGGASLFAAGPLAPRAISAQEAQAQQVCISSGPILRCTPPPQTSNPKTPPPRTSSPGGPTPSGSGGGGGQPQPSYSFGTGNGPVFLPPDTTPLPTLPPPGPGAPPEPPELAVQSISLLLASAPPSHPGGDALIQATLEAQRGADTYSVPHAHVAFLIAAQSGTGADVIPAQTESDDTGVVLATVVTGSRPGDTIVRAISGNASADIRIAAGATPSPTPQSTRQAVAAGPVKNGPSDSHGYLVAALAALVTALIAGYVAAMALGRLPNPLQRRSVWGRRSSTPGR